MLIPAWNEERVIVSTVKRMLESLYPALEIIVIDDGSTDRTAALVAEHFAGNPLVTLLSIRMAASPGRSTTGWPRRVAR